MPLRPTLKLISTSQWHRQLHHPTSPTTSVANVVAFGVGSLQDMETTLNRLSPPITPSMVTHVIDSCNTPTSSRRLLRFLSWCRRNNGGHQELGDEIFNHAIRAFASIKDLTAIGIAMEELRKEGRKLEPETFVQVTDTMVQSGRPEDAIRLFRSIQEKKQIEFRQLPGNWSSVTAVVHALCSKGHARKAEGVLWHHQNKDRNPGENVGDNLHESLLLHGWCVHGNVREARRVLDQMKLRPPSLASYHDLLRCTCDRNLKFNPSALVTEANDVMANMRSSGVRPTAVTYNILLSFLGRARRVKEACRILLSMARGEAGPECAPDCVSYYIVIRLLYLTGRFATGNKIVGQMLEKGLVPTASFFRGLIGVLCGVEKMEVALQMFDRMKKCCGSGNGENGNDTSFCLGPTYDLLITKLCTDGNFEIGRRLWDEAMERAVVLQCSADLLDPLKTQVFKPTKKQAKLSPGDCDASKRRVVQKNHNKKGDRTSIGRKG